MALSKNILVVFFFVYATKAVYHGEPTRIEKDDNWNNSGAEINYLAMLSTDDIFDGQKIFQDGEGFLESRNKKSQTRCRVKKIQKTHEEIGAEFFPKQYNEYECVPFDGDLLDGNAHNLDVCYVNDPECTTLQKKIVFGKMLSDTQCVAVHEKIVKVGCKCHEHFKFHFH
ncbi:uncharacterized protein [Leptinotarsa decemlineata]|uniref:uncharacterized protein n=1 Tax=Leptinotarsa decemlineata TaxID=7539 RepID=UPI003D30843C